MIAGQAPEMTAWQREVEYTHNAETPPPYRRTGAFVGTVSCTRCVASRGAGCEDVRRVHLSYEGVYRTRDLRL